MNQKQKLRKKHQRVITKTVRELAVAYSKYTGSIRKFLLSALYAEGILKSEYSETYIQSTISDYSTALQREVDKIADARVEEAFLYGLLIFYEDIGSPISVAEAKKQLSSTGISYSTKAEVKRLLSMTTSNTDYRIKKLVTQSVAESMLVDSAKQSQNMRLVQLYNQTHNATEFQKALQREGFVGIVDARGAIWKPDVYAKMVMRTKLREADVALQKSEAGKVGVDLAWISDHHVDNPCNLWENTIISLSGLDKRFPSYEEAKATKEVFHPNCQHYLNIIRDVSMAPIHVITTTEQKYGIDLSEYK